MWLERTKTAALVALLFIFMEIVAIAVVFKAPAAAHEAPPATVDVMPVAPDQLAIGINLDLPRFLARTEGLDHDAYSGASAADVAAKLGEQIADLEAAVEFFGPHRPFPVATKMIDENGRLDILFSGADLDADLRLGPSEALGPALVRVFDPASNEITQTVFAAPGEPAVIALSNGPAQNAATVIRTYLVAGFDHILPKGMDHILFVIGLFLLSPALRPLLVQVSLFTVAHTTTLAFAATGLVSVPASIVEPLIAASIAFIAVENLFRSSLSRWRPWVIFGFGLLHGLGFASVLADFGLPPGHFAVSLAAFNIGVELGQLTVLAICFLAVGLLFRQSWYRNAISIPASALLACIGMFWFVQRVAEEVV
ncbi:MAG: HupE/UreJ family protein [Alphaproteobacteria bacterium]|nr:HupE/UreJ family protein [Alphaproteobacteria bacterium]